MRRLVIQKLAIQQKRGDGAVIGLLDKLNRVNRTPKSGNERIKAVGMAIEEFVAKVIAETIIRGSRGF